jgi:transketolase
MRKAFAEYLAKKMEGDPSVVLITADLGYGLFDDIKTRFPDNFINCGASEHLMMSLCVAACYEGKRPVAYSITPFLIYRPFEVIRNYVNKERLNVKMVGSGRNKDYHHDGFSHWAEEDVTAMRTFENIKSVWPSIDNLYTTMNRAFSSNEPYYINLCR